jgi:hypothetical protein
MVILEGCAHYYHDNELLEWKTGIRTIPRQCNQFNAVYNLMHYHLDVNFMPPHVIIESIFFIISKENT